MRAALTLTDLSYISGRVDEPTNGRAYIYHRCADVETVEFLILTKDPCNVLIRHPYTRRVKWRIRDIKRGQEEGSEGRIRGNVQSVESTFVRSSKYPRKPPSIIKLFGNRSEPLHSRCKFLYGLPSRTICT